MIDVFPYSYVHAVKRGVGHNEGSGTVLDCTKCPISLCCLAERLKIVVWCTYCNTLTIEENYSYRVQACNGSQIAPSAPRQAWCALCRRKQAEELRREVP